MPLAISMPIFNKTSYQTQAEECLQLQDLLFCFINYPIQSLRHSTARVRIDFLLKIDTSSAKGIRKTKRTIQSYFSTTVFVIRIKIYHTMVLVSAGKQCHSHETSSTRGKIVIGIPHGVNGKAVLHFIPVQKWKT